MFRIIDKQGLQKIGADPYAEFALAAINTVSMNAGTTGTLITPGKGGTHGYFPDFHDIETGFIGYGAGFTSGHNLADFHLTDIAPLVAKMLGMPFSPGKKR